MQANNSRALRDVITACIVSVAFTSAANAQWQNEPQSIGWRQSGHVLWRFSYDPQKGKPFFNPVAAGGASLTTFQPEDHPWHYGLWFSWKYLNGANYWEEDRQSGHAEGMTRWSAPQIDARPDGSAAISMDLNYTHPSGRVDMTEARELRVSAPAADGSYTIDWQSRFVAGKEGALLDRTPMPGEPDGKVNGGYAGLGVRLASAPAVMSVVTTEGPITQFTADRARPASSAVAANFTTGGRHSGAIAILSDPSNSGERAPWYVVNAPEGMRFLCAAVLAPAARRIPPGGEWRLRYRIVLQPAQFTPQMLAAAVAQWNRQLSTKSAEVAKLPVHARR